jgi:hemerythrin-like metal-binding protein
MEIKDQETDHGFTDMVAPGHEHSDLMAAIDRFNADVTADAGSINYHFSELITTIYQLFQYEEYLMETSKYPLSDLHTSEHNRIVSTMIHAMTGTGDHEPMAGQVAGKLRVIFRIHAENFDRALFEYFRKKHSS